MGISEFFGVLRRRWVVVVVCVVVAAAAAVLVSDPATPEYTGSATVLLVDGLPNDVQGLVPGYSRLLDRDMRIRVVQMRSDEVANAVIETLDLDEEPAELLARVSTSHDDNNQQVVVTAVSPDPEQAADIANAFVDEYAALERARQEEMLEAAAAALEIQRERAREEVEFLPIPESVPPDADVMPPTLGGGAFETMASALKRVRVAQATQTDPVIVVSYASPAAGHGGGSGTVRAGIFGVLAGLAVGVILAFMWEYAARPKGAAGTGA